MQVFVARVKYRKTGLIRFIGHLDTVRALLRAVRRAGIECVYSQGFTPRLKLSFGPPLPLGCTSECEFFDINLARASQADSIQRELQAHLPEGLRVEEVQILHGDCMPLTEAFWAAEYEIEIPRDCLVNQDNVENVCSDNELTRGGNSGGSNSRVVRARWQERDDGTRMLSIVLRQNASGKGGLKDTISNILGIPREATEKCNIHKKNVLRSAQQI